MRFKSQIMKEIKTHLLLFSISVLVAVAGFFLFKQLLSIV